jgi:hypothetical protein
MDLEFLSTRRQLMAESLKVSILGLIATAISPRAGFSRITTAMPTLATWLRTPLRSLADAVAILSLNCLGLQ